MTTSVYKQPNFTQQWRRQRGFALVALLLLTPVLLALGAFAATLGLGLAAHSTHLNSCRQQLIAGLSRQAQLLERLLALNKQAARLHQSYLRAKMAVMAAPQVPVYQVRLARQVALAMRLRHQQQVLRLQMREQAQRITRQLPLEIEQRYRRELPGLPFRLENLQVCLPDVAGALMALPLDEITTRWEPRPDFSQASEWRASWRLPVRRLVPAWIVRTLDQLPGIPGECRARLKQGALKWTPALSAVKF